MLHRCDLCNGQGRRGGGRHKKRGKGMKIMAIVDRHGLPLSVNTHTANHHEVRLVHLCFDFYMIEAKPENLIGDLAYDSDPLDEELHPDEIETTLLIDLDNGPLGMRSSVSTSWPSS